MTSHVEIFNDIVHFEISGDSGQTMVAEARAVMHTNYSYFIDLLYFTKICQLNWATLTWWHII